PGIAGEVDGAIHIIAQHYTGADCRRPGSYIEVGRARAQELRIGKVAVGVLARAGLVLGESGIGFSVPDPLRIGGIGGIIEVVIHIDRVAFGVGVVVEEQVLAGAGVDDVVLEYVVRCVVLHLEFTASGLLGVVRIEGIIDNGAVICPTALAIVTANGNPVGVAVVDQIVPQGDVIRELALVLTGELDIEIRVMDRISLDDDMGATIDVDAVGCVGVAVIRITERGDVVDRITRYGASSGAVISGLW